MADVKISALPSATAPLAGAELVPVVQAGITTQTTITDIVAKAPVQSVAGKTGAVTLTPSDVGAEPADATILKSAAIGVTVQGYNANTVVDAAYVHTDNNYTTAEKSKLAGIADGAEVNVNADWNAVSGDAQILNKPTLGTAAATASTDYATAAQGTLADSAVQPAAIANMLETADIGVTVQGYSSVLANTTASFTTADETKLDNIAAGAEVNVNADWNATSGDAQILNKPTLGTAAATDSTDYATAAQGVKADSALQAASIGVTVQGYSSVLANTTASFTTADETKLDGIATGAEVNVNADWNATSGDAQILNKPFIPTNTSDLTNDSGFITSSTETDPIVGAVNGIVKSNGSGTISAVVSGTDIKTVNGTSLLGSGDLTISSGSSLVVQDEGTTLTSAATSLNFTGAGVTATNTGSDVTVTISGVASGSAASADIQEFTTVGTSTWTKPVGAKLVHVLVFGGGGGGGSGRNNAGGDASGGAGGGAGTRVEMTVAASILGATESITVGAGGTGGASQTVSATNGNAGSSGGSSSIGTLMFAYGGNGGSGGSTAGSGGGTSGGGLGELAAGGTLYSAFGGNGFSSSSSSAGNPGAMGGLRAGGGGGGGGFASFSPGSQAGAAGGLGGSLLKRTAFTSVNTGGGGSAGTGGTPGNGQNSTNYYVGGNGGGGGASGALLTSGGAGGYPSAGGGGGGSAFGASGAGGNGGDGYVRITTFF